MTPSLALKLTVAQLFTWLAVLVGLSGLLETYALRVGGPTIGLVVGDALQGLALVLFVYHHTKLTGQGLSLKNVATVLAVIVGASGAVQTFVIHIGGAPAGAIAGGVLQGLALLVTLFQQLKGATPAVAPHG